MYSQGGVTGETDILFVLVIRAGKNILFLVLTKDNRERLPRKSPIRFSERQKNLKMRIILCISEKSSWK
jgi:hypothetical protein